MQLTKTRVWILESVRNRSEQISLLCMKKILCFSVEPDQRKGLSRHGSVEIFDGAYNLTVPNKLARHSSTSKLEEIHSDHIKIVGEMEDNQQSETSEVQTKKITGGLSVTNGTEGHSHTEEVKVNNESTCVQKTSEENSFSSTTTSSQRSEMHESVTSCQQTSYEEMRQTNFQVKLIKRNKKSLKMTTFSRSEE